MATTRRSWTKAEEVVLITAVKWVIKKGFKSDNGFRAGYVSWVEDAIAKEFPNTDLKATQINSKITAWKKSYYSLTGILNRSGVGFNSKGTFMIEIEDEQWEHVIKADPTARSMRYKSWPYYEDWQEMFGKDRATGEGAEDVVEAYEESKDDDTNVTGDGTQADYDVSLEDMGENEAASDGISQSAMKLKNEELSMSCSGGDAFITLTALAMEIEEDDGSRISGGRMSEFS